MGPYVSLYRKYRPQTFAEILGQDHVARTLANAISEGRWAHAYLFTGPRGTGKTSTARILAKALNCVNGPTPEPCGVCDSCVAITQGSSLDVFELDAASHSGVDETREILSGVPLATAGGHKKVYVIDEVHMLTTQSFNALLKTLEEPPEHVVFVLATTEAHKVLPTIVSRTQRFDFRRVSAEILEAHLAEISKLESIDIEPDALGVVARHAEGSVRDALSALDQLSSLGDRVAVEDAERLLGERDEDALFEVFDAISGGDLGALFSTIHLLVAQGADIRQLALAAMSHARSLLLLRTAPDADELLDAGDEDRAKLSVQAERFEVGSLVRILDLLGKALTEMRNAPSHRLLLEVALIRAAAPDTDPTATGLQGRIDRLERRIGISSGSSETEPASATPAGGLVPTGPDTEPASAPAAAPAPARSASTPRVRTGSSPSSAPPAGPVSSAPASSRSAASRKDEGSPSSAPPAAPAGAAVGSVGLGDVRDAWGVAVAELDKMSRRVAALLKPSRALAFDGEVLQVEVQSNFHRDEMSELQNRSLLADAIHAALGIRPELTFITRGDDPVEDAAAPGPAPDVSDIADAKAIEEADAIELVKQGLGGEVVEERSNR